MSPKKILKLFIATLVYLIKTAHFKERSIDDHFAPLLFGCRSSLFLMPSHLLVQQK
jgi:hypothetical protein